MNGEETRNSLDDYGHCKRQADLQGVLVKIGAYVKFLCFQWEFLENRCTWENENPSKDRQKSGLSCLSLAFSNAPRASLHIVEATLAIPAAIYRSAQEPGPESAPRSAFWVFLGTWLWVRQRVLYDCFFLAPKTPKSTQKALFWALGARCPKTLKKHFPARAPEHSCKWRLGSQDYPSRRSSITDLPKR